MHKENLITDFIRYIECDKFIIMTYFFDYNYNKRLINKKSKKVYNVDYFSDSENPFLSTTPLGILEDNNGFIFVLGAETLLVDYQHFNESKDIKLRKIYDQLKLTDNPVIALAKVK